MKRGWPWTARGILFLIGFFSFLGAAIAAALGVPYQIYLWFTVGVVFMAAGERETWNFSAVLSFIGLVSIVLGIISAIVGISKEFLSQPISFWFMVVGMVIMLISQLIERKREEKENEEKKKEEKKDEEKKKKK